MEKKSSQLHQRPQEELTPQQQTTAQAGREFATPEELLRFDAAQTKAPPGIEQRLQHSLEAQPKPPRSWWQRLLGW